MNYRPPPFAMLLLVFCAGIALSYWILGAQSFDRAFRDWLERAESAPVKNTPPTPPSSPPKAPPAAKRSRAEREQRGRAAGLAALSRATSAVWAAKEAQAAWLREVEPLRRNYEGHLIAAHDDLVARFRRLYDRRPAADAVTMLTRRLERYSSTLDIGSAQGDLARLEAEGQSVTDRYRAAIGEAAALVAAARRRGWWSPVELGTVLRAPAPVDLPPWYPAWTRRPW